MLRRLRANLHEAQRHHGQEQRDDPEHAERCDAPYLFFTAAKKIGCSK